MTDEKKKEIIVFANFGKSKNQAQNNNSNNANDFKSVSGCQN